MAGVTVVAVTLMAALAIPSVLIHALVVVGPLDVGELGEELLAVGGDGGVQGDLVIVSHGSGIAF